MSAFRRQIVHRRGVTIFETIVTLVLLLAAAGAFAQMHALAARQQRAAEKRAAAAQALANWMERCSMLPYGQLEEDELTKRAHIEGLQAQLPGLETAVAVQSEEAPIAGKRVVLTLRWPAAGAAGVESARLVGWRHQRAAAEESSP